MKNISIVYIDEEYKIKVLLNEKEYMFETSCFHQTYDCTEYKSYSHNQFITLTHWWRAGWQISLIPNKIFPTENDVFSAAFNILVDGK